MKPRFDGLIDPGILRAASSAAICCPRYVAGVDAPPALIAGALELATRCGELLRRAAIAMVRNSPATRM